MDHSDLIWAQGIIEQMARKFMRGSTNYLEWLKARITEAEQTGEFWMLDGLAIARAWRE